MCEMDIANVAEFCALPEIC